MIWLGHSLSKWRIYACVYNSAVSHKNCPFLEMPQNNLVVQSNSVIRNFLVTLKLFLNANCSLSLRSKWTIGHGIWFLYTNLFLIKTFLITKFDCNIKTNKIKFVPKWGKIRFILKLTINNLKWAVSAAMF